MTPTDEGASSPTGGPALAPPTATAAAPPVATAVTASGPSTTGRFLAAVVGHLAFGALVLGGVLFWQNYPKVLTPMADTVCADHLLGQYRSAPGTMLAAERSERAKGATQERSAASAAGAPAPTAAKAASAEKAAPTSAEPAAVPPTGRTAAASGPAAATAEAVAAAASAARPQAPAPRLPAVTSTAQPPAPTPPSVGTVASVPTPGPDATVGAPRTGVASEREPSALPQPTQTRPVATVPQPPATVALPTTPSSAPVAASAVVSAPAPAAAPPAAAPAAASAAQLPAAVAAKSEPARPAPPAVAAPLTERWQSARTAYRSGDPRAIERYAQLIKDFPDVADLPGELGNIFYGAGRMQDAAEQYFEAAQRHLRGQSPGMAACLVAVLKRLNSPLADRLAEQAKAPCPLATQDAGKGARSG
ncbi:MAG: hypothetical protein AB1749_06750 [Pseudomonadota bacterium]